MPERWRNATTPWSEIAIVRVAQLASRQFGVVARRQLAWLEISNGAIERGLKRGHLFRRLPGVYSVGHTAPSDEAALTAAVLYAGPDALLSHATAAWWLGLADRRPPVIEVSAPRRCKTLRDVVIVHDRQRLAPTWSRQLPVAPIAQVLLGYAWTAGVEQLRRALAEAEYRGWLDVRMLDQHLGRGRPGSAALRRALAQHDPRLALTKSGLERRLMALCDRYRLPRPEINAVEGLRVDALWRAQKVVVEVDGPGAHGSWARIQEDRRRELILRTAGLVVLRYVDAQLRNTEEAVAADIANALTA